MKRSRVEDRNQAIFYAAWNCLMRDRTQQDIADKFGISRGRVQQIKFYGWKPFRERRIRRKAIDSRELMVDYIREVSIL